MVQAIKSRPMTAAEAILAKSALARSSAEAEAYRQGVEDGADDLRERQFRVLVFGLLLGNVSAATLCGLAAWLLF